MRLNPLALSALIGGGILWVVTLIGVVRGRGMTPVQRWLTGAVLIAAPVGIIVVLR